MKPTTLDISEAGSPFAVRLRYGDREAVADLPIHRLADSRLESKLSSGDVAGMAEAVDTYKHQLLIAFSGALGAKLDLDASARVVVRGGPELHAIVWESLRLDRDGASTGCEVLRIPPISTDYVVPENEAREGRLTWIGSRPAGDADVGRYRVLAALLPLFLQAESAITARALRTDATLDDLPGLLAIGSDSGAPIVHLDAHGLSTVEAAAEALIDEVFAFWVKGKDGPAAVGDRVLFEHLPAGGCELFTTNGCFSAQQRGVLELPFPAQLVQRGVRAAIGAREPLKIAPAGHFFLVLYGHLIAGQSIGASFAAASSELARHARVAPERPGEGPDRSALFLLQPVLWLADASAADRRFVRQQEHAPELTTAVKELVAMAISGGTVSALAGAVEDITLRRAEKVQVRLADGAGWDLTDAQAAADALAAAVSGMPPGVPRPCDSFPVELHLGDATDMEREVMIGQFHGPQVLRWLLAEVVPPRPTWLRNLAQATDRDAGLALLATLSWGGPTFDGEERVRELLLEHRADLVRREAAGNRSEGVREFLNAMASHPFALPVSAGRGESFLGLAVPPALGAEPLVETAFSGVAGTLGQAEGTVVCLPYRTTQLIARAETSPRAVMAMRAFEIQKRDTWERPQNKPFGGPLRRQICLTWLTLAVAARQVGVMDPLAISQALLLVGGEDAGAAAILAEYLRDGLPTWESLGVEMASVYEDVAGDQRTYATSGEDSETRTDQALRALKARKPDEVFEIFGNQELSTFEERKAAAYALARTGESSEARALVLPDIRAMGQMSRFDRCELLHLLAHIAELDGHRELAIQHMLEERALNPPRPDVRLHNRIHLLDLLAERVDVDLHLALAEEALPLAVELKRRDDLQRTVQTLVVLTVMLREHRLADTVTLIESYPAAHSLAAARLAGAVLAVREGDATPEVEAELRDLAKGEGWAAAEACAALAVISDPRERREWLVRAGTTPGCADGHAVKALDELWDEGDEDALEELAESIADVAPSVVAVVRAALSERRGSTANAQAGLATAFVEHGLDEIHRLMVSLSCGSEIGSTTEEAARAVAGEKLVQRLSGYLNGNGTVDVMHTLRRLREFAETTGPEQAEDHLGNGVWFVSASEHLWDRDELEAAAQARRIACRFFEIAGATSDLAMELGWLGTLEKQLGRTAAAETLYQRAVALGEEDLDVEQLASLVGRYANLLHQLGQRQAALALQWRATCLLSAGLDRDEPLTEEGLGKLPAQEPEVSLGNRMGWLLQLANLANCLFDTGQPALADQALALAEVRFEELAGSAKAVDEKHVRAAADMLVKVRRRLELLKGEQGDPEGCA